LDYIKTLKILAVFVLVLAFSLVLMPSKTAFEELPANAHDSTHA